MALYIYLDQGGILGNAVCTVRDTPMKPTDEEFGLDKFPLLLNCTNRRIASNIASLLYSFNLMFKLTFVDCDYSFSSKTWFNDIVDLAKPNNESSGNGKRRAKIRFNPYENRSGERVGGGFFVFRRGKKTGRVGVTTSLPFEHPSFTSAKAEAERLAKENPGETYVVLNAINMAVRG